jgi:hypothetical protein
VPNFRLARDSGSSSRSFVRQKFQVFQPKGHPVAASCKVARDSASFSLGLAVFATLASPYVYKLFVLYIYKLILFGKHKLITRKLLQ